MVYRRVGLCALLLALGVASAQIYPPGGGYPPGGYPPTGYPGQRPYPGGGGIPIPTRGGKTTKPKNDTSNQPLPNFRGKLKQMDNKTISLELGDNRVLDFKRNDKTKFFKNGDEIKNPKFNPGDQVSIEGPEDNDGYMTAVNVYWEKAAGATTTTKADDKSGAVDTWADKPSSPSSSSSSSSTASAAGTDRESATEKAPPPSKDSSDPGPPKLTRGRPSDPSREHNSDPPPQPATVATAAPPPAPPAARSIPRDEDTGTPTSIRRSGDEDSIPIMRRADDPLIRKSADAALDFTESLPNYVCQEMMTRYQSESHPANWQPIDVVTTNLVYENGKEDYRDVKVNGKPKKSLEESGGAWSTGEFGTVLIDLFSPATAADFHFRRDSRTAGIVAKMYDFDVSREHSHWSIHMGSQSYDPPYKGSVWIDPQTSRVLRIEMEAYGFPDSFPTDHVESATDYQYVRLGDAKQYLLPVHAETLTCQRGSNLCSRNTIDFRNYHKYSGESNITFGDTKEVKK